jgi:hypothetical protein
VRGLRRAAMCSFDARRQLNDGNRLSTILPVTRRIPLVLDRNQEVEDQAGSEVRLPFSLRSCGWALAC